MAGWEQARRRYRLVHDVAGDVAWRGPRALGSWRPAIEDEYGDVGAFLRDVQRRYHRAAEARLDAVIEDSSADVAGVLDEVAAAHPDLRRLLEAHPDHPALAEGDARFRWSVRAATGVDPALLKRDETGETPDEPSGGRKSLSPRCAVLRPVLAWLS